jgi:hypothetical protein
MSNLKTWLHSRRAKFYEGAALQFYVDSFLQMVERGADVYEFPDAIIVLEHGALPGERRGWLLFDHFNLGTVRAMKKVSDEFTGTLLFAETHDIRIRDLLLKLGYMETHQTETDYYLVKRGTDHGM